jgi:hypothetical protein
MIFAFGWQIAGIDLGGNTMARESVTNHPHHVSVKAHRCTILDTDMFNFQRGGNRPDRYSGAARRRHQR